MWNGSSFAYSSTEPDQVPPVVAIACAQASAKGRWLQGLAVKSPWVVNLVLDHVVRGDLDERVDAMWSVVTNRQTVPGVRPPSVEGSRKCHAHCLPHSQTLRGVVGVFYSANESRAAPCTALPSVTTVSTPVAGSTSVTSSFAPYQPSVFQVAPCGNSVSRNPSSNGHGFA